MSKGRGRVKTAGSKLDNGFYLFAIQSVNYSMMSFRLAPAWRFSKMADTGMRVPFSTHAPLTFPGTLSTALHCDQSKFAMKTPPHL